MKAEQTMHKPTRQPLSWVLLSLLCLTIQLCDAASLDAVVSVSFKTKEGSDDCTYTLRNRSTRAIYYAHPLMQFSDAPKAVEHIAPPPVDGLKWQRIRVRPDDSDSFDFACPKPGEYAAAYVSLDESSRIFTLVWSRHKNGQ